MDTLFVLIYLIYGSRFRENSIEDQFLNYNIPIFHFMRSRHVYQNPLLDLKISQR